MDQDNEKVAQPHATSTSSKERPRPEATHSTTETIQSAGSEHVVDSNYVKRDVKLPHASHKGAKVFALVMAIILLALGGVAGWFFIYYDNPDKVLADAVTHFYQADNIVFDGGISLMDPDDEASPIKSIMLDFDLSSLRLPFSTEASLLVLFDEDAEADLDMLKLKLGLVWLTDGAIYLQLGGLHDTIASLNLTPEQRAELQTYIDTFEQIDNEWWRISVPDLIDQLELDSDYDQAFNEMYVCVLDSVKDNDLSDLAPLYRKHSFFSASRVSSRTSRPDVSTPPASGYKAYEITLDRAKLADFLNAIYDQDSEPELVSCLNRVARKYNFDELDFEVNEFTAEDFELPEDFHLYAEISYFGHELRSLNAEWTASDYLADAGLVFTYQSATVNPPDSYRSLTELSDTLIEAFAELNYAWSSLDDETDYPDADYLSNPREVLN